MRVADMVRNDLPLLTIAQTKISETVEFRRWLDEGDGFRWRKQLQIVGWIESKSERKVEDEFMISFLFLMMAGSELSWKFDIQAIFSATLWSTPPELLKWTRSAWFIAAPENPSFSRVFWFLFKKGYDLAKLPREWSYRRILSKIC